MGTEASPDCKIPTPFADFFRCEGLVYDAQPVAHHPVGAGAFDSPFAYRGWWFCVYTPPRVLLAPSEIRSSRFVALLRMTLVRRGLCIPVGRGLAPAARNL